MGGQLMAQSRAAHTEYARAWRAKHPDRVKAANRRHYQRHREERLAVQRTRLSLRALRFANRSNERAVRHGVPGVLTPAEVATLTGPCAYCGGEARGWDHVLAMVLGGENTLGNLVPACWPCNRAKGRNEQVEASRRVTMGKPTRWGRLACGHAAAPDSGRCRSARCNTMNRLDRDETGWAGHAA